MKKSWLWFLIPGGLLGLIAWKLFQANQNTGRTPLEQLNYTVRGLKNNNPGNLRGGLGSWKGVVGLDGSFLIFDTPTNGVRALMINGMAYQYVHDLWTLKEVGDRWAPV